MKTNTTLVTEDQQPFVTGCTSHGVARQLHFRRLRHLNNLCAPSMSSSFFRDDDKLTKRGSSDG